MNSPDPNFPGMLVLEKENKHARHCLYAQVRFTLLIVYHITLVSEFVSQRKDTKLPTKP